VDLRPGLARIVREENERDFVKFSVRERDLGSLVAEAQGKVDAASICPKVIAWKTGHSKMRNAQSGGWRHLSTDIVSHLLPVVITFNSASFATLSCLTCRFSAGGFMALPLAGLNLSVAALVGFVALFGIVIQKQCHPGLAIAELRRETRA